MPERVPHPLLGGLILAGGGILGSNDEPNNKGTLLPTIQLQEGRPQTLLDP